jgi:ATP-binding cassette subfamily C protein
LPRFLHSSRDLISRVFFLARPYGSKKLAGVFAFSLAQGVFQVVGVSSIFPFLALASDPGRIRDSSAGIWVLDRLPAMTDAQLLMAAGIFALVMLFLSNAINLGAEINRAYYVRHFGHWLRVGLLQKIVSRPYGDFLQQNSGVLLKKVNNDVMQYTSFVLLPLLDSSARLITVVLLLATLLLIDPLVAIGAALVFGAFYLGVFRFLGKRRRVITDGVKIANRGIMREAQQLLGGIKPIKVHRAEEPFLQSFRVHSKSQAQLMAWMPLYANGPRYLIEPLAFGGVVVLVLVYAARGESFTSLLPTLGVMALAGYRLLPALQLLYSQATTLTTTRHALDEVFDEFAAEGLDKEIQKNSSRFSAPPPLEWQRAITLENLMFQYPGTRRPVIENLSLTIPKNSSVGIIGTTGSGKSTLVDLILGLHRPTSGQILIDSAPLTPENRRAWRGGIGYVPQDIFLIDDTLFANIAFGIQRENVDAERLREAAAAAQILNFIESLPRQWESWVGERGVRLSGGQRQRIGLARALYHRPSLLILDEATSALDTETEAEVMKSINALNGSITILIIAHRVSTIANCGLRLNLGAPSSRQTAAAAFSVE